MSALNLRDYYLELELSIPESIPCTKREVSFPITDIDLPTFEVTRDIVGLFPNTSFGRDLSKGVECGHEDNADLNAAVNIKNRVDITVLCDKLLKQSDNGIFRPKPLKRAKVKEVLLSCRNNIVKDMEKSKLLTNVNNC
jgi:hypothetical protein